MRTKCVGETMSSSMARSYDMNEATLNRQVDQLLESLRREFADELPATQVTAVGEAVFDELRRDARISDFIPVLVYRYARDELLRCRREELNRAA